MADALGSMHGFPAALTSFVGRAAVVDEIADQLGRDRLVTVTGPGGAGKTRLAGEVAKRVSGRFADGVWLAELAAVGDPAQVAAAVAAALGVRDLPSAAAADALASALARRQLLLVLDNCEQVIGAAAELCGRLLLGADDVRVLATSREPLRIAGEARYRLASVFQGPFTLEGAEAVAGTGASPAVLHLVDCSLLARPRAGPDGRSRYGMLETLRAYGAGLLAEAGEGDAVAAALAWYALQVAEDAMAGVAAGTGEVAAARWLDAEDATTGQVLDWAMQHDAAVALRLAAALAWWWQVRGRLAGQVPLLREAVDLRVLFLRLPTAFAVAYWRRVFASPRGELWFGAHTRAAPDEMRSLAQELQQALRRTGASHARPRRAADQLNLNRQGQPTGSVSVQAMVGDGSPSLMTSGPAPCTSSARASAE